MSTLSSQQIVTPSGLVVDYVDAGDPRGVPLVLLHGYTDSWRAWTPLIAQLPRRFRVIAVSQRGHGESGKPAGAYRLDEFALDLEGVLDALGVERAVVVGHSMGTLVATRFALDRPSRVHGLVLIAAFATLKGNPTAEAFWHDGLANLGDPIDPALVRDFQQSTLARSVPQGFFESVVAESLKVPARIWRAAFRSMLEDDYSADLTRIVVPALVVWGDRDAFAGRAEQELLKATLADATLKVHPGNGHAPHWEDPERVARQIADFVDERIAAPKANAALRRAV